MPENTYTPRTDDFRIGYFKQTVTDLTSTRPAPYRDMINRWHLEKKDPSAEISDPVEPMFGGLRTQHRKNSDKQ